MIFLLDTLSINTMPINFEIPFLESIQITSNQKIVKILN